MNIRIGQGYDIHRLVEGRALFLGGVEIPHSAGLLGHSDGDCLIHALIDALLGALGESDIGRKFPDTEPRYKNMRSTELLRRVWEPAAGSGVRIINADTVVLAERPRLADHIPEMKKLLCPLLSLESSRLGIKAKTHEGMGEVGRGEAIAAMAVVLLDLPAE